MQKLVSAFAGRWKIVDKSAPGLEHPAGITRTGEELWHTMGGGIPLIEEYRAKTADGTEEYDTAVFWWDAKVGRYAGLFCASFVDEGCTRFDLAWHMGKQQSLGKSHPRPQETEEPDQIVMSGEYLQSGKRYAWRETFVFLTPTAFAQTLFLGEPGRELKREAVISATKIGDAQ